LPRIAQLPVCASQDFNGKAKIIFDRDIFSVAFGAAALQKERNLCNWYNLQPKNVQPVAKKSNFNPV
jgi:hypothetical protein